VGRDPRVVCRRRLVDASAATPPAKFSFNSGDGRCPTCGGSGFEHVEMQFLSDVYLRCPDCDGKRYRPEILEVTIERKGRRVNVADVLDLTVSEAADLFSAVTATSFACCNPSWMWGWST